MIQTPELLRRHDMAHPGGIGAPGSDWPHAGSTPDRDVYRWLRSAPRLKCSGTLSGLAHRFRLSVQSARISVSLREGGPRSRGGDHLSSTTEQSATIAGV